MKLIKKNTLVYNLCYVTTDFSVCNQQFHKKFNLFRNS
jgi:hypothetical protein